MSLIDFCFVLVFAQLTESRVIILREYDEEPLVLDRALRSRAEEIPQNAVINLNTHHNPTKKMRSVKKSRLQFGRHIYHLDKFKHEKKLRSKISEQPVSYDYVGFDNRIRNTDSGNNAKEKGNYLKDVIILSGTPLRFCNGQGCEDRKAFRKFDDHKDWKRGKNKLRYLKRFEVVNRYEPNKSKYDSSEDYQKKKKSSSKKSVKKKNKKKKHKYSSDSHSDENSSESRWSKKKKKYNSDESQENKRKSKKKYIDTSSDSIENWKDESTSIEDKPKKHKKKKTKNVSSDDANRKTNGEEDYFMQGNRIFHSNGSKKKHRHEFNKRRRLEHFMPKRYHWDPEDIHDLGYYWFNGPRGAYPGPKPL